MYTNIVKIVSSLLHTSISIDDERRYIHTWQSMKRVVFETLNGPKQIKNKLKTMHSCHINQSADL